MSEENKSEVTRRRLLRRAGTLAAGAGVAGVASAAIGSPAQAADGDPLLVGRNTNTATSTTVLTGGNTTTPTLNLTNATDGPSLVTKPVVLDPNFQAPFGPGQVPSGTVYVDDYGDINMVGRDPADGAPFVNLAYSPTWSFSTVPVRPMKIVHTWDGYKNPGPGLPSGLSGRHFIEGATYDSFGRVLPKSSMGTTTPDMVINLSEFISVSPEESAVQGVLIIEGAQKRSGDPVAPFLGMWDEGPYPFSTTLSYNEGTNAYSTFVQVKLGSDGRIRLKLSSPGLVVFDITGFVVRDWITQFGPRLSQESSGAGARASGNSLRQRPLRKS